MQKFLHKINLLIFLCIICSCAKVEIIDPFILSHLPNIQSLERQDHRFCASLNINFDKNDDLRSEFYWRCRLSLAKYKIQTVRGNTQESPHNLAITDLIGKISLKLSQTPEAILTRENKEMDERQHRKCLTLGYEIATEDQAKIDDYFACRRALIEEEQLVPPFGNNDYLQYQNRSYDIGFVIDQRLEKDIEEVKKAKEAYPACAKFNLHNINFKRCTNAQDNAQQCFMEIPKKRFKKEWEEKIICQKKSYAQFPDSFLKTDQFKNAQIVKNNSNSAFYNNQNLSSLGLSEKDFSANAKEEIKKELEEKNINNKDNLYARYELTTLRRDYIFSCQKEAITRINKYLNDLELECKKLEKFKIVGDY